MTFAVVYEDPSYEVPEDSSFYYDLDEDGNWVEVHCDADGNPIVPESYSPFETVNS